MNVTKYFGPPGTGKTSTLLKLVEQALEAGVPPNRIGYLSFTNAACDEAVSRAMARFGFNRKAFRWFSTIHSVAYRKLGIMNTQLVRGPKDLVEFSRLAGFSFSTKRSYTEAEDFDFGGSGLGDRLLEFDHYRRARLESVAEAHAGWNEPIDRTTTYNFCEAYQQYKEDQGMVDFTDLLLQLEEPLDVDILFVDEAQDLSKLQWRTLSKLAVNVKTLILAGDDDQAVFTWAGASPESFIAHPGEVVVLGQSYRVPRKVHTLAEQITKWIPGRQPKVWAPRDAEGAVKAAGRIEGALDDLPDTGSVLILYRNHYMMREVENHLREIMGLPYSTIWGPGRGLQWVPAIVAWERLRAGKKPVTIGRAVEALKAVGGTALEKVKRLERMPKDDRITMRDLQIKNPPPWFKAFTKLHHRDVAYLRRMIQKQGPGSLSKPPRIRLSTIHSAKGAEADHVLLMTDMSKRSRQGLDRYPGVEERVFYVGVTRAKEILTLVGSGRNPIFSTAGQVS